MLWRSSTVTSWNVHHWGNVYCRCSHFWSVVLVPSGLAKVESRRDTLYTCSKSTLKVSKDTNAERRHWLFKSSGANFLKIWLFFPHENKPPGWFEILFHNPEADLVRELCTNFYPETHSNMWTLYNKHKTSSSLVAAPQKFPKILLDPAPARLTNACFPYCLLHSVWTPLKPHSSDCLEKKKKRG